jgi:16S rRNA (guanine(527)-N(7))-methyltransferase RsmG
VSNNRELKRHTVDTARIAALLEPFLEPSLSPDQLDQISIYIDLLLRWNARINLTAIRHPEEIVTRHFGESFFLARHLFLASTSRSVARTLLSANPSIAQLTATSQISEPSHPERSQARSEAIGSAKSKACPELAEGAPYLSTAPRVLDIGSGAGFPALPLKLWASHIHLTLIESNHKKAAFLREVARALTLTNIDVLTDRAELLAARPDFPRAQVVTLRAVEHFATVLPQAVTLVAPRATLALLIGAAQIPHLTTLTTVKWHPPIPVPQSQTRVLSIGIHQKSGEPSVK